MKISMQPQAVNLMKDPDEDSVTLIFGEVTGNTVEVGPFPPQVWEKFLEIANDPEGAKERAEARAKIEMPGAPVLGRDGRRF